MREVVVGVDGSEVSERAVDRALFEAETTGRRVRLVHVRNASAFLAGGSELAFVDASALERDEQFAQELVAEVLASGLDRRTSGVELQALGEVQEGDPGRQLVGAATQAGLVVVGGHGRGGFAGALLGSSTGYVLHHADCPVMVVPQTASAGPFRRIVVGVDGSAASRSALRWGLDAARRSGCGLVALYAWRTDSLPAHPPMEFMTPAAQYEAAAGTWLERELAEALPEPGGVDVQQRLVHQLPSWGLLEQTGPQDLLVVGSRGLGGFSRLLLGSVATQCTQHASSAVVVVRADQERLDP